MSSAIARQQELTTSGAAQTGAALAEAFRRVDRHTPWQLTDTTTLRFPTHHPQGLVLTPDRIFLSSVEILEPTKTHPAPEGRHDRTPGRGRGHLFVMDSGGDLLEDIRLGHGDAYHPGGIDWDGTDVWVPVSEYRPHSSALICAVDATTLEVRRQFEVADHIGGIVKDRQSGHLVGHTWGSRRFVEWNIRGRQLRAWPNGNGLVDYQDGQYAATSAMICAGVATLPQTPSAGGADAAYELGGVALIDIATQRLVHEIPFQRWSTAGHVATRNPFAIRLDGDRLTVRVAPDNGDEGRGTQILTYEAVVRPGR